MQTNVLEYLERTIDKSPEKLAYTDGDCGLRFNEVSLYARSIGTFLHNKKHYKEPVVVFMEKHPYTIAAFFGVVYAGCFYVPLDSEMPRYRLELIRETLKPRAVICSDESLKAAEECFKGRASIYLYRDVIKTEPDNEALSEIRRKAIDLDPVYIAFTSGSTGTPKGVTACHRSVVDYIENLSDVLEIDSNTVFGNQSPLYFDACLKELYPTLKFGATAYLIPKRLFLFPALLVEYLNENKINTICWVASSLTYISALKTFDKIIPKYLRTVAFGSEVFPVKHFKIWKSALPEAKFINLYGPTEATGMSCYYKVESDVADVIPIGEPFKNTSVILLDENDREATGYNIGEICIRGSSLALGYYGNPEKTKESFIQNPLNDAYPEIIYRTGDLGRYNDKGELLFVSRRDYQIKHMGYRIELGEIESAANDTDGIRSVCCLFDDEKKKIVLFYEGNVHEAKMAARIKEKLPGYMVPSSIKRVEAMPLTPNGKLDRSALKASLKSGK